MLVTELILSIPSCQICTGTPPTQCKLSELSLNIMSRAVFRFQISNTDHIIDVNSGPGVAGSYHQINIICPSYSATFPLMVMTQFYSQLMRELSNDWFARNAQLSIIF